MKESLMRPLLRYKRPVCYTVTPLKDRVQVLPKQGLNQPAANRCRVSEQSALGQ